RRKTLWKRRTVEKSEERLFPRAWKSRQVRGIPTFPQRPRRLDDEESQKPKPDISLATKSGHFNLLRTRVTLTCVHKAGDTPTPSADELREKQGQLQARLNAIKIAYLNGQEFDGKPVAYDDL